MDSIHNAVTFTGTSLQFNCSSQPANFTAKDVSIYPNTKKRRWVKTSGIVLIWPPSLSKTTRLLLLHGHGLVMKGLTYAVSNVLLSGYEINFKGIWDGSGLLLWSIAKWEALLGCTEVTIVLRADHLHLNAGHTDDIKVLGKGDWTC